MHETIKKYIKYFPWSVFLQIDFGILYVLFFLGQIHYLLVIYVYL